MSQLFTLGDQSIGASASTSVLPVNTQGLGLTGLISLQSKVRSCLHQHHNLKATVFLHSAFFVVQLSHPYMTTGKTIALTIRTFVSKVMSLLFNMLSRFVIAFFPGSKCLLIWWLQSLSAMILEPKKIKSATAFIFSPSICHEVIGPNVMILVLWMLSHPYTIKGSINNVKRQVTNSKRLLPLIQPKIIISRILKRTCLALQKMQVTQWKNEQGHSEAIYRRENLNGWKMWKYFGSSVIGFPGSSAGKESTCNAGDPGSIPELGRSAGEGVGYPLQCSWASLMTQLVKNLPAVWETRVWSLVWENLLEKGTATHSSILAWRIP